MATRNIVPRATGEGGIGTSAKKWGAFYALLAYIEGGTISGADITVGSGKTLDVSAGTLTIANDQISGDKIHGGTISAFTSTGIDDNADAVAITIDSSERVGIGTTSPVNALDVEGAVAIGAAYSGTSTAPTNGLIVEGNVGIGTASPSTLLHLKGDASIKLQNSDNSKTWGISNGYASFIDGSFVIYDHTTPRIGMIIMSDGKTGLGVATPVNKLDVEGAVAIGASYSGTSTAPTNGLIVEGNVGIGTASPKAALDVGGVASGTHYGVINSAPNHATAYSETSTSAAGEPGLYIQNKHNSGAMASIKLSVRETAQSIWEISNVRTADYLGDLTFLCRFGVSTFNERMRITSSGNVGIGTASPTAKLHLPACTAAANTASLKIDAGTVATTPVSGNIESDGVHLWWTNAAGTRIQLDN